MPTAPFTAWPGNGTTLYLVGVFTAIGKPARLNGAAINLTTGAADRLQPGAGGRHHSASGRLPGRIQGGGRRQLHHHELLGQPGLRSGPARRGHRRQPTDAGEQPDPRRGHQGRDHVLVAARTAADSTVPATPTRRPPATSRAPSRPTGTAIWSGSRTATATPTRSSRPAARSTSPGTRTTAATWAASPRPRPRRGPPTAPSPSAMRRPAVLERTSTATSTIEGQPQPTLLNWFPDINAGTFTGQSAGAVERCRQRRLRGLRRRVHHGERQGPAGSGPVRPHRPGAQYRWAAAAERRLRAHRDAPTPTAYGSAGRPTTTATTSC